MIAHYGCFEDVSAVIDTCPPCSVSHAACLSFELDHLFSGQSVLWDQRVNALPLTPLFLTQKKLSCTGQNLSLTTSHLSYCIPLILASVANDPDIGTPFAESRLLTATLWPFSLPFNVQVLIPVGSYGFVNLTSPSVDGCYLYIIIHYGMLQRDWGIRSVPRGGRPDPESFKVIDTYTYSKNHTNSPYSPYVCPRML